MKNSAYKRYLIGLLLLALVAPILPLNLTRAQTSQEFLRGPLDLDLPTTQNLPALQAMPGIPVADAGLRSKAVTDFLNDIKKILIAAAQEAMEKLVLDRLVDALIAYINRGYKGGIVQNWDQFLEDAKQDAVGILAKEAGLGFLCSPFNIQVQLALITPERFSKQFTCKLDQITGNIEGFLRDFKSGNWIAYQELWYPENNYYGATIGLWNQAEKKQREAALAAQNEAIASRGFLSVRKCVDPTKPETCRIVTPGEVAATLAPKALTVPIDRIIGKEGKTSVYLAAVFNAAISQLTKAATEGILKLGRTEDASRNVTPTTPCAGLTGEAFRACVGYRNLENVSVQSNRAFLLSQLSGALKPRQQAANYLASAVNTQQTLVTALQDLTAPACQPTNANKKELEDETETLNDLQTKFDDNQTFIEQIEESIQTISQTTDLASAYFTFNNNLALIDAQGIQQFVDSAKAQNDEVQKSAAAKLPSIQANLKANNCSTTSTPTS